MTDILKMYPIVGAKTANPFPVTGRDGKNVLTILLKYKLGVPFCLLSCFHVHHFDERLSCDSPNVISTTFPDKLAAGVLKCRESALILQKQSLLLSKLMTCRSFIKRHLLKIPARMLGDYVVISQPLGGLMEQIKRRISRNLRAMPRAEQRRKHCSLNTSLWQILN